MTLRARALLALLSIAGSAVQAEDSPVPSALPRYVLVRSVFLGGGEWEEAREVLPAADGTLILGAQTCSPSMPVTAGVLQPRYAGDDPALGHSGIIGGDVYLARVDASSGKVIAATYFGGSKQERNAYGLALDREGNIVVCTATRSEDCPTTEGAFQRRYGGGPADMLVAKVSSDLKRILWCTYLGGSGDESPRGGLAIDPEGNVVVVGTTTSPDFPASEGSFQRKLRGTRDSVLAKLRADGSALLFGSYLGGDGEDDAIMGVRIDASGNLRIAGHTRSLDFPTTERAAQAKCGGASDAWVAAFSGDGCRLLASTYLGGARDEFAEHAPCLLDDGSIIVTGFTASPDFPVTPRVLQRTLRGPSDGFVARVTADAEDFRFSMPFGGSGTDNWLSPALDGEGNLCFVGSTGSRDLPVTPDAIQQRFGGGETDGALVVLSRDASELIYATYLGGSGEEVVRGLAFGPEGEAWLVGTTTSEDFPAAPDSARRTGGGSGGKGDAFLLGLQRRPTFPAGDWVSLFDGKSLGAWRPFEDAEFTSLYGKVGVADGAIVLEAGGPMTGIRWTGDMPREDYEVSLEAMRSEGRDFFCGLTFPVGPSYLSFICGGWSGSIVGISNVDSYSAVENQTTSTMNFESKRWYRVRVKVTREKVEAWIDDDRRVDLVRKGHRFSIWPQQEPGRPLGITSYGTKSAVREIRVRRLASESR